jgi:site-specific recombinase XerD
MKLPHPLCGSASLSQNDFKTSETIHPQEASPMKPPTLLEVGTAPPVKRLPELLTDAELVAFYEAIWHARQLTHGVMLKLLLFTGIRNTELVHLRLTDVDLQICQRRITQGKSHKDRYVLFPTSFRGELAQYLAHHEQHGRPYLFESNRSRPYSTRRLRQIVKQYAKAAGITKRVYPHLFRHQLLTYLTKHGLIRPKLQLLSGHTAEQSLAVYRALALSDVSDEYEAAMRHFPVR